MRDVAGGLHAASLRQEKVGDVGGRAEGLKESIHLTLTNFFNPQVLVGLASEELAKGWTQW